MSAPDFPAVATAVCSVCGGPYVCVPDDPSPAHPSCAPADPAAFEAGLGRMAAADQLGCRLQPGLCPCGGRCVLASGPEIAAAASAAPTPGRTAPAAREDRSGPYRAESGRITLDSTAYETPGRAAA